MNILLWILQVLLAVHTAVGAVWKFSNPEQSVPSLQTIPHGVWLALGVVELFVSLGLILPAFTALGILAPIAAAFIMVEMLVYCAVHLSSGSRESGPLVYWLVVAVLSAFVAYGRFVLVPH